MRVSNSSKYIWEKLLRHGIGVVAMPIIPLYMLAYRLMGKRCFYRWGETEVRPMDRLTENEYLFTRLFPASVLFVAFGLLILVSWLTGNPLPQF